MDVEQLINRHKDAVYRQMVRTCGNREDAEDALADALLAAFRATDQLRDPAHFQAWLARIGTRACMRMQVRQRIGTVISLTELEAKGIEFADEGDPGQEAEKSNLKECVRGAFETLPELYRDVYMRREVLGEKAEDVARELKLSVPAVKSRLLRARQMMRSALDSGIGC